MQRAASGNVLTFIKGKQHWQICRSPAGAKCLTNEFQVSSVRSQ